MAGLEAGPGPGSDPANRVREGPEMSRDPGPEVAHGQVAPQPHDLQRTQAPVLALGQQNLRLAAGDPDPSESHLADSLANPRCYRQSRRRVRARCSITKHLVEVMSIS